MSCCAPPLRSLTGASYLALTPSQAGAYACAMNSSQLAAARATLEDTRRRLTDDLSEPLETPSQMTYGSQAAAASEP